MTKVVVNRCFGGYGLSKDAYRMIAKELGRECYFLTRRGDEYVPCDDSDTFFFMPMDIPNFGEQYKIHSSRDEDGTYKTANAWYNKHLIPDFRDDRTNPILIKVVESLGKKANGSCSKLKVVEIPDDIEWEINDYDGSETVEEKHRSW